MRDRLDRRVEEILAMEAAQGMPPPEEAGAVQARLNVEKRHRYWNQDRPPIRHVTDLELPLPGRTIRARLYRDHEWDDTPTIIYIHVGGWVFCSIDTHDHIARRLAWGKAYQVLSIDYRRAPEHAYP